MADRHAQITSLDTAAPLTLPAGATSASVQCVGGTVRYRCDNINPTSSVGKLLADGATIEICSQLRFYRFIKASGSPKLEVFYSNNIDLDDDELESSSSQSSDSSSANSSSSSSSSANSSSSSSSSFSSSSSSS